MNKLTIEEKAKAYDDVIKKLRDFYRDYDTVSGLIDVKEELANLIPELAESEDEKIRKNLISMCQTLGKEEWVAWFEKQGEQKPTKVEPKYAEIVKTKFKDGDWVVYQNEAFQVRSLSNGSLILQGKKYQTYFIAELCRPWTIQDAKDGDVLACESGWTCIFKKLVNDETFSSYCFMDNTKWFCETGSECHTLKEEFVKAYNGKIYPATEEQRDTLEKAMADAGYIFDFEKKELKKVEQKPTLDVEIPFGTDSELVEEVITIPDGCYAIIEDNKVILRKGEQKPWSEEVDLELVTDWFDHIAQIADDRMTLTGQRMTDSHALDEIKCIAKNSSEFITKHYKAQKGE